MSFSDTLADFAAELDDDLRIFPNYPGRLGERIEHVRDEAESLCMILGVPNLLSADFISPYRKTDRPIEERWSEWRDVYKPGDSIVSFLEGMLKVESQPDHIVKQVKADLAELQATE